MLKAPNPCFLTDIKEQVCHLYHSGFSSRVGRNYKGPINDRQFSVLNSFYKQLLTKKQMLCQRDSVFIFIFNIEGIYPLKLWLKALKPYCSYCKQLCNSGKDKQAWRHLKCWGYSLVGRLLAYYTRSLRFEPQHYLWWACGGKQLWKPRHSRGGSWRTGASILSLA